MCKSQKIRIFGYNFAVVRTTGKLVYVISRLLLFSKSALRLFLKYNSRFTSA
jgi:hypothetical protein